MYLCTEAAGVQELAEEVEAAGEVAVEEPEEAGAAAVEAEGLAEGEEHLPVARVPQLATPGDRHA